MLEETPLQYSFLRRRRENQFWRVFAVLSDLETVILQLGIDCSRLSSGAKTVSSLSLLSRKLRSPRAFPLYRKSLDPRLNRLI